jgi:hypothetical protein
MSLFWLDRRSVWLATGAIFVAGAACSDSVEVAVDDDDLDGRSEWRLAGEQLPSRLARWPLSIVGNGAVEAVAVGYDLGESSVRVMGRWSARDNRWSTETQEVVASDSPPHFRVLGGGGAQILLVLADQGNEHVLMSWTPNGETRELARWFSPEPPLYTLFQPATRGDPVAFWSAHRPGPGVGALEVTGCEIGQDECSVSLRPLHPPIGVAWSVLTRGEDHSLRHTYGVPPSTGGGAELFARACRLDSTGQYQCSEPRSLGSANSALQLRFAFACGTRSFFMFESPSSSVTEVWSSDPPARAMVLPGRLEGEHLFSLGNPAGPPGSGGATGLLKRMDGRTGLLRLDCESGIESSEFQLPVGRGGQLETVNGSRVYWAEEEGEEFLLIPGLTGTPVVSGG